MRIRHVIGACALALLTTSCSLGDAVDAGSINVFLEVDDSQLTVGQEAMTITVTARNVGFDPVTLTGPSDCLLFVEILDTQGTVVWNSNGSCVGAQLTEALIAGQDKVQSFVWDGSNLAGAFLSPGFYTVRGIARVTGGAYVGPPISVALD